MINTMHSTTTTPPQDMDDHLESRQPAQPPVVWITEGLIGVPPTTFDGDRSKADGFITRFGLFRIINHRNPIITNPEQRVALALSYIRGPKVEAWVAQQYDALSIKVDHAPTHADTNEALWEDFIAEFKRAFAEPLWEVFARLEKLRMAGDEIEMYIATFENLVKRAKCNRESRSMMDYFLKGLPNDFWRSIMNWPAIPNTIDEWQSAARNEVEKRNRKKFYLSRPEGRDTNAAQFGATRLTRLSKEERERYMDEGRCFECDEKGHLARNCPDKVELENVRN